MKKKFYKKMVLYLFLFALVDAFTSYLYFNFSLKEKINDVKNSAKQIAVRIEYSLDYNKIEYINEQLNAFSLEPFSEDIFLSNAHGVVVAANKLNNVGRNVIQYFDKEKLFNEAKVSTQKMIQIPEESTTYLIALSKQGETFFLYVKYNLKIYSRNVLIFSIKIYFYLIGMQLILSTLLTLWFENDFFYPIIRLTRVKDPVSQHIDSKDTLFSRNDEIGNLGVRLFRQSQNFEEVDKKLKLAQAHSHQNQKLSLIGQMTASVAHEVKNPIAFITMMVSGNIADKNQNPLTLEDLGKIKDACDRANITLHELLSFSRQSDIEKDLDLHMLLNNLVAVNGIFLKERNHIFQIDFAAEQTKIHASPTKLQQIFTNLISNASDSVAAGQRGLIEIRTFNTDSYIIVSVSDNGSGIEEKDQTKIFKNFFTTKESGHGTGLGMGIVNNLVEELNGSLWFETEVGKGSTFYVKIPFC